MVRVQMGIYMHFFFRLSERKRCQKERTPSVPVGLLRMASCLKGRNSLRSDSLPFLTASGHPPLHARRSMPESHAASSRTMQERSAPHSTDRKICRPTPHRSSPGDSALDFFLLVSFLFAARQKEKYTDKLSFLFAIILLSRELGKCRAYNVSKWKLYVPWC